MDKIEDLLKKELISQNNNIFFIILYVCGGVMFLSHFYKLIGKQDSKLLQRLIDTKVVKVKMLGRSKLIVAKYYMYKSFGLDNKTIKLTSKRILHSALVTQMLINTYGSDLVKIEKMLKLGNLCYFLPSASLNFLNRIYNFLQQKQSYDLTSLQGSILELEKKVEFLKTSRKGRKDKLIKSAYNTDDLLTLRSNDIYIRYADYRDNKLYVYVAILANSKSIEKISEAISKTEKTLEDTFYGININIYFDIYSLQEKSVYTENKVKDNLLKLKNNAVKEDYYNANITFNWYNCRGTLLSGIDIAKWL